MNETNLNTIREFVVDELMDDPLDVADDDRLFEQGLIDSMNLVRLLGFLEETFSIKIPVSMVTDDNLASIEAMAKLVDQVRD